MTQYQTLLTLGAEGVLVLIIGAAFAVFALIIAAIVFLKAGGINDTLKRRRAARQRFTGRHVRRIR